MVCCFFFPEYQSSCFLCGLSILDSVASIILSSDVSFIFSTLFGKEKFKFATNTLVVHFTIGDIQLLAILYSCAKYL